MKKRYIVKLSEEEREELKALLTKGKASARTITRARILLKSDQGDSGERWTDQRIADALDCSIDMCQDVRQRFVEEGLHAALHHKKYKHLPRKVTGEVEAHLIALSCSPPPEGRASWTLQLLADNMVELGYVASISDEHVRRILKKTNSNHGLRRSG